MEPDAKSLEWQEFRGAYLHIYGEKLASEEVIRNQQRARSIHSALDKGGKDFFLHAQGRVFRIAKCSSGYFDKLARAYQSMWGNAEPYKEDWTIDDAQNEVMSWHDCCMALDESDEVVGLVSGMPLDKYDDESVKKLVLDIDKAYYIAEWVLVDSLLPRLF